MPGRPKTERRREPGEAPKGTKLSRVGTKMTCRLCGKSTHNARRCPKNPEAGKKKNAHIKRDAKKTKKDGQPSTSANRQSTSRGKKRKLSEDLAQGPAQVPVHAPAQGTWGSQTSSITQPASQGGTSLRRSRIAHLLFGDNI
ncbi:uncharacterized protein LOC120695902 [Panicum virgatum]|nr:uncharacterized protein LOC120695902 [Panicum virgatum]